MVWEVNFLAVERSELDRKWPPTIIHDGVTCPHVTHGHISVVWCALIHSKPRCRQVGPTQPPLSYGCVYVLCITNIDVLCIDLNSR